LKRINVKVAKETHLLLCALSDSRNKPFDRIIFDAIKKDTKKTETIKNLELETERLKEKFPEPTTESMRDVPCPALIDVPNKGLCCANKAPRIVPIPTTKICKFCWERQQKLKAVWVPQASTVLNKHKKPEKIYCLGLTSWVDPLKTQAMCYRCKTQTLERYAECQQKRLTT